MKGRKIGKMKKNIYQSRINKEKKKIAYVNRGNGKREV